MTSIATGFDFIISGEDCPFTEQASIIVKRATDYVFNHSCHYYTSRHIITCQQLQQGLVLNKTNDVFSHPEVCIATLSTMKASNNENQPSQLKLVSLSCKQSIWYLPKWNLTIQLWQETKNKDNSLYCIGCFWGLTVLLWTRRF